MMKLIVMTRPDFFIEEDKILTALFDEGLDSLHLYKPNTEPVLSERLLSLIPESYCKKIIVHEHHYLKNEFNLGGINVDNENAEIQNSFRNKVSCTCNKLENLYDKNVRKKFQYSLLDSTFTGKYSLEQLQKASDDDAINKKVYAMGNVTIDNIRQAQELGFGGVVVRGDLWNKFDIHRQVDYKDLISYFIKIKKIIG